LEQANVQSPSIQCNERDQRTNNIRRQRHTQPCLPLRVGA
jgi:hypothetical protein